MSEATILVVDDSDLSRALISRILQQQDWRVMTASDGAEGAVIALSKHPDAVVTDLEMPVMDGYQLARLLKSDPASSDIPVLILTSHTEASSRFWGLETGANAYLVKDDLSKGLVPMVEELLRESEGRVEVPSQPPKTPLEVLARVSRHLDSRLLEAVVVTRLLETGMKADDLEQAAKAVVQVVSEFLDADLLAVSVSEPESAMVYLRAPHRLTKNQRQEIVERLLAREKRADMTVIEDPVSDEIGRVANLDRAEKFPLQMREVDGTLLVVARSVLRKQSREHRLITTLEPHFGLVLDNARLAQRLRELSTIDGLTKILNRGTVSHRLAEEIDRSRRYDHPLSIILCDLDRFKQINDTYGHQAGDAVLQEVAATFVEHARSSDQVGRFGGEEFLLVLPETEIGEAIEVSERLLVAISSDPFRWGDDAETTVTASIGVSALSELAAHETSDALVARADKRLYEAKETGRNRVVPPPARADAGKE